MTLHTVTLPTLHPGQVAAYNVYRANELTAVRCGRRWGKTDMGSVIACDGAIKGQPIGWFAPDYKIQMEAYNEMASTLEPVKKASSKVEGVIRTITGGRIDFWTMENERAGRSRKYKVVIIDEAAFTKANAIDIWEKSIKPTLFDLGGKCLILSNTNGVDPDNFLYQICEGDARDPLTGLGIKYGFADFNSPSFDNPHIPNRRLGEVDEVYFARRDAAFAKIKKDNHPLVYQQEFLAKFVDWSGIAFFGRDNLLVNDLPVAYPRNCDLIYATIDTAVKTGTANDGTAVTYWALSNHVGYPLIVLDWEIIQLEGSMLEVWLPNVFKRLEELVGQTNARGGVRGAFIEDKSSGMILLQQAAKKNLNAYPIDSKLTSVGKDERAINVSGYVYQNKVKVSEYAYNKVMAYKGVSRNHFMTQVMGFRIGDKDAATRADDLLDTFTYGVAIGLGNRGGF